MDPSSDDDADLFIFTQQEEDVDNRGNGEEQEEKEMNMVTADDGERERIRQVPCKWGCLCSDCDHNNQLANDLYVLTKYEVCPEQRVEELYERSEAQRRAMRREHEVNQVLIRQGASPEIALQIASDIEKIYADGEVGTSVTAGNLDTDHVTAAVAVDRLSGSRTTATAADEAAGSWNLNDLTRTARNARRQMLRKASSHPFYRSTCCAGCRNGERLPQQ